MNKLSVFVTGLLLIGAGFFIFVETMSLVPTLLHQDGAGTGFYIGFLEINDHLLFSEIPQTVSLFSVASIFLIVLGTILWTKLYNQLSKSV
ncbi:hypothetical protein [Paenisporosarcina cavernae]|uniref:Uncharacterized protein n=1 Tax=Paenisporosarcina cavernae TaxID=2320858 RepID=A0A385YUD2_9BACL|nr:hypothetical protein [Paenisporosarcina cavernae]AYC30495.1 hypothetical protein D3873_11875 [Paenisporosarcina cavernae]